MFPTHFPKANSSISPESLTRADSAQPARTQCAIAKDIKAVMSDTRSSSFAGQDSSRHAVRAASKTALSSASASNEAGGGEAECHSGAPSTHQPLINFEIDFRSLLPGLPDNVYSRHKAEYGKNSLKYYKGVSKWNKKPVADYEEHMATSKKSAWLNEIPKKIDPRNLVMHGTNLDVVLRAIKMGGQLLPVGQIIKRGGQIVTGEFGITPLNLRRVSTMPIHPVRLREGLLYGIGTVRSYAELAVTKYLKVNNGGSSHVPIVVVGDGLDKGIEQRSNWGAGLPGLCVRSDAALGEVAFQRVNIRTLHCRQEDLDYVRAELKRIGSNLPATTYESIDEALEKEINTREKQGKHIDRDEWRGTPLTYKSVIGHIDDAEFE